MKFSAQNYGDRSKTIENIGGRVSWVTSAIS